MRGKSFPVLALLLLLIPAGAVRADEIRLKDGKKLYGVIVAYEDMRSWGYGAEIAARIADELFDELDAPVKRVAAMDSFCGYHPKLEDAILPQTSHIAAAVKEILSH